MKKIIALLMVTVLALSLAGCSAFVEGFKDGYNDAMNDAAESNSAPFEKGTVTGQVYTSDFSGLTFTAPADWRYYSDQELADLMNVAYDEMDMNIFTETAAKLTTVYDMLALNDATGTNVIVLYENLAKTGNSGMSEEDYFTATKNNALAAGYEFGEPFTATLGGDEFFAYELDTAGVPQYNLTKSLGDYMCVITVTLMDDTTIDDVVAMFS